MVVLCPTGRFNVLQDIQDIFYQPLISPSCRTIIYELMMLEYPYKCLPLQTRIWRVGKGDLQALTLVPKGRLRNIIWRCWVESPLCRPSFKELLATIEQDVSWGRGK